MRCPATPSHGSSQVHASDTACRGLTVEARQKRCLVEDGCVLSRPTAIAPLLKDTVYHTTQPGCTTDY